jgi:Leu/Phe-tRNA-protein transferase
LPQRIAGKFSPDGGRGTERTGLISTTYKLTADALLECFDDGALILNLKDVTFTELNPTARDILQATDGNTPLDEVARRLAVEYEIDLTTAQADVLELYQQLLEQEIIEPGDPQKQEGI